MRHSHYFATDREHREAMQVSSARIWDTRKYKLWCLGMLALGGMVGGLLYIIPWRPPWIEHVVFFCWMLVPWFSFDLLWRKARTRELWKLLRERRVPICLHCGYDLRGLTEAKCPECGNPFEPEILTWQQAAATDAAVPPADQT